MSSSSAGDPVDQDVTLTDEEFVKKINDIHAWMAELMPFARSAVKLFAAKQKLMSRWVPGARRDD